LFTPGYLSAAGAALLNDMARQYQANGFRIGVTSWPLTVSRPGRMQGTIIGIDPKAFRTTTPAAGTGTGTGTSPSLTVVTDICLSPGGDGGFIRKAIIDPVTGEILDEFCEAIPTCGSGENGGLCDDLPPPSGSGSGSGEPGTIDTTCCPANLLPSVINVTFGGGVPAGTYPLTYNAGISTIPTNVYWEGSVLGFAWQLRCNGGAWTLTAGSPGSPGGGTVVQVSCDPLLLTVTGIFLGDWGTQDLTFTE
jgi:hypothetical protein